MEIESYCLLVIVCIDWWTSIFRKRFIIRLVENVLLFFKNWLLLVISWWKLPNFFNFIYLQEWSKQILENISIYLLNIFADLTNNLLCLSNMKYSLTIYFLFKNENNKCLNLCWTVQNNWIWDCLKCQIKPV